MNKILNALKEKLNSPKRKVLLRTVIISVLALALVASATFAWYINNMGIWGVEFKTGNIDFTTYVYGADGVLLGEPVSSKDENESSYTNVPLITLQNAQVGTTGTIYFAVKSTGSIGIQYRIAFDIKGVSDDGVAAYLGGYKYNISKVTDKVPFNGTQPLDITNSPQPENLNSEMITIDRNAVNGTIEQTDGYDVYRMDYTLAHKNQEYTGNGINIYFNVFATQIDGDFEDTEEIGNVYYCSTKEEIDRAKVEAYPGDIIKLSSDIVYYGDLVFNKPINLETNNFTLTVNGNFMYDYVLGNSLKLDAGGLGKIVVQCTKEGIGGNFQIKAPLSDVAIIGSNAATGDIVVEKSVIFDATDSFGSSGVSFNEVKIVDLKNSRKTIQLESNTRATVAFGTTIGIFQSVTKANNIQIVNNGIIGEIILSNMAHLPQTNSPQIYILNNKDITNPIRLPSWSEKFQEDDLGNCIGNTRIIQSYSASTTSVTGNCIFDNDDIEVEAKDSLVEQIEEGNDSRLRIYYRNVNGQTTTIQSILEEYLATSECSLNEVMQLEIISVGSKAVTNDDIYFMNSNSMLSLKHLDMQRANIYDKSANKDNRLVNGAFKGVTKYENLVLPQTLAEIGSQAFLDSDINNIVTIPSGVTAFGSQWFNNGDYVSFAASVPVSQATNGLTNVKAIFVEEAYIESYKSVYSGYTTKIYPISVLDETKTHFVRNTNKDEWEITYYIKGEDSVIGDNITIDGNVLKITSIYDNAYRHNFTGTKVKLADTVRNLGAGNFYNNKNITEAELNNLKYLGDEAFYDCSALANVAFGGSLETIGAKAFYNCISLNQDIVLPDTMRKIGTYAFYKSIITSVKTGGTVSIDGSAFESCAYLIYAELPNVKLVGEDGKNNLFSECSSLVSVKIPSLTNATGTYMFSKCAVLREVYMGANNDDVSLGKTPFINCDMTKLKLYVPEEHIEFYRSKRPGNINATMIYPQGEKMGEELVNGFNIGIYIVSDNGNDTYTLVTSNIDHSEGLIIPETFNEKLITGIYDNAFRNQGFTNVTLTLGNNVESIGSYAFYQKNIVEAKFGNSLAVIDDYAFADCTLAQDIVLPDSMESIGAYAFTNTGILSVNTGGTTSLESGAFYNCKSLIYVKMPEVAVVAESGTNYVFYDCSSLVSVDMPKLAKAYGTQMFRNCNSLMEVYMGINDAGVTLGTSPFLITNSVQIKLFVPEELVSLYQGRSIVASNQVYPIGEKVGDKAVNGFVVGDYILMENDEGYTLVTSHLSFEGEVVVPNEYNDKPITEIYSNAFRNQSFADVNLVLGNNIKVIGSNAFNGVTGLTSIVMDHVTSVMDYAFFKSGIKVLNGPRITYLGNYSFSSCSDLEIANVPKIENIENSYVFYQCKNLKTVYFENIISWSRYTFISDSKLEKIIINRLINSSGDLPKESILDASTPCKIYVPYRSLAIYPSTWSGKPVVTFDISATNNGDTYILEDNDGRYVLIDFIPGQTNAELIIPNTVYAADLDADISIFAIDESAFTIVFDTLKSLTLPSSVALINRNALSECTALENIYVDAANTTYVSVNGVLYTKDAKLLVKYPAGRSGSFDMSGADYSSTVGIGANAFANATNLTQIVFPESLVVIDSTAFTNCLQLDTVEFTGNTPPILMGAGIFDTSVLGFKMIIPAADSSAYLNAYYFNEYEPYMD